MKLIHGDCLEEMRKIPDKSVDLVITSPPYNCGIDYGEYKDNLSWDDYLSWCEEWILLIRRLLKPDGRFAINVLFEMGIEENKRRVSPYVEFFNIITGAGPNVFGSPLWVDSHRVKYTAWGSWMSASSPYIYNPYEVILIGYNKQWKKENKGKSTIGKEDFMMGCSGIWKLKTQTKQITPASFHKDLPSLCINLLSYEVDTILDPFMGSGTTGIACKELGRDFIGIEISKEYYDIAVNRINNTMGSLL
jgi:site-specific DNA-methyltransferase (adenine-specific)